MALEKNTTILTDQTVIFDNALGGVAIDYSRYYERIATAVETVATNSNAIKNTLSNIELKLQDSNNIATLIKNILSIIEYTSTEIKNASVPNNILSKIKIDVLIYPP
jgi:methyl-accepting chemotaxis protein